MIKTEKMKFAFILIVFVLLSMNAAAQFFDVHKVRTNNFPTVEAHLVTKNRIGNDYPNLSERNFKLYENGVDMSATMQYKCEMVDWIPPVNVVLVIDASQSMYDNQVAPGVYRIDWAKDAAKLFLDSMKFDPPTDPPSKVAITTFGGNIGKVNIGFQTTKPPLYQKLTEIETAFGDTDFNPPFKEDVWGAINLLKKEPSNVRRVIVFLTDGKHESLKEFKFDEIGDECKRERIQVYSVVLKSPMPFELNEISIKTGAWAAQVKEYEELRKIYHDIAEEITSQDLCWLEWQSHYTCDGLGRMRDLKVTFISDPDDPDAPSTYKDSVEKQFDAGEQSIAGIDINPKNFTFSKVGGTAESVDLTLEASVGEFDINSYNIVGDNSDFTIDWKGTPPPFKLMAGEPRTITVTYVKDPADQSKEFTLEFESNPCPVPKVKFIAPCDFEAMAEIDFGSIPNATSTQITEMVLKNTTAEEISGDVQLTGPDAGEFGILSGSGPFTLYPDEELEVSLSFIPTTVGAKQAFLEYNLPEICGNAVTELKGTSYATEFPLEPYNFGLHRVESIVTYNYEIKNTGDSPANILAVGFEQSNEHFSLTPPSLPVLLAPGESMMLELVFNPKDKGPQLTSLLVTIENINVPVKATISGTAFKPHLTAEDIVFPVTKVGNVSTPMTLTLENKCEYGPLKIDEIKFNLSAADFRWVGSPQLTNRVIDPKSSITFQVEFAPTIQGTQTIYVDVVCDAVDATVDPPRITVQVKLTGSSIDLDISPLSIDFGELSTCETATRDVTINNNSDDIISVSSVDIDQAGTEFTAFYDFLDIQPGGSGVITIEFKSTVTGIYSGTLNVETNAGSAEIPLSAESIDFTVAPYFDTELTRLSTDVGNPLSIPFAVDLPDLGVSFTELEFVLTYNPDLLKIKPNSVTGGPAGWNWNIDDSDDFDGTLILTATGPALSTPVKVMGNVTFDTYISSIAGDNVIFDVNFPDELPCVRSEGSATMPVTINSCYTEGGLVDISTEEFGISEPMPNPVKSEIRFSYSIAFKINTTITLYNSMGEVVRTLVSGVHDKNLYELSMPTGELTSGIYFYRIEAGPYVETKQLIIAR